jgi:hypothetical protein
MLYCSREHQASHRSKHKLACNAVKQKRDHLESEEQKLRAQPADDFFTPADVFDHHVGHFWGIMGTRDYMRAIFGVIEALRKISTLDATQTALDHAMNVLRLNRSDNMGVRNLIPALFLRLGRDQDCYDFVKWYQTTGQESDYDWGDLSLPFLHIRNANALESVDYMCGSFADLSHVAAITLLKIKLLLDVKSLKNSSVLADRLPMEIVENIQRHVPQSAIISSNKTIMHQSNYDPLIAELSSQVELLYTTVDAVNEHFWLALVHPEDALNARPEYYSPGSESEMQLFLQYSFHAWLETPRALDFIKEMLRDHYQDDSI